MNTRAFLVLLIAALVVGGGGGGIIVAVLALGNGGGDEATVGASATQSPTTEGEDASNELDGSGSAQLGDQALASEPNQEQSTQPPEQSQGRIGQGPGRGAFSGGGRLIGTVQEMEGSTLTISTQQGLMQAIIGPDSTIQRFTQGTLSDLEIGMQARVIGERGEDGTLQAQSIVITPEGAGDVPGGGFAGGGQLGNLSQEELDQLRQQFQGRFGQGTGDGGQFGQRPGGQGGFGQRPGGPGAFGQGQFGQPAGGGGGLTGTIEQIKGTTITINTSRGPLLATIGEDTTIQMFVEGTLADLQTGVQVTVTGQPGEDGSTEAQSIQIIPEGEGGLFGAGFLGGGQRRDQESLSP